METAVIILLICVISLTVAFVRLETRYAVTELKLNSVMSFIAELEHAKVTDSDEKG